VNILFVCKHNVYRSKLAEYFFKKINTGTNVSSGGIFAPGGQLNLIQLQTFNKSKINLSKPKAISFTTMTNVDIIVIVANDIPISLFKDKKYGKKEIICWNVPDRCNSQEDVEMTIEVIKKKVKKLALRWACKYWDGKKCSNTDSIPCLDNMPEACWDRSKSKCKGIKITEMPILRKEAVIGLE